MPNSPKTPKTAPSALSDRKRLPKRMMSLIPAFCRDMGPAEQLARLPHEGIPERLVAYLLPGTIERWHRDAPGRISYVVGSAVRRAGMPGLEALAPWFADVDDAALMRATRALMELVSPGADLPLSGTLSPTGHAAWTVALERLRAHVPRDMTFRLVLPVAEVDVYPDDYTEPGDRSAKVTCYQKMFIGMAVMTPHIIERTASGRFRRTTKGGIWPLARDARPGFDTLLDEAKAVWPRKVKGWVAVFESSTCTDEVRDWQDGRESFTASRAGLKAGTVIAVRPKREDDPPPWQRTPVVPDDSLLAQAEPKRVEFVTRLCRNIEMLLASTQG